jgi:hypothetical protein
MHMTTYRTGNHWGVTIVREAGTPCTDDPEHLGQSECAELVAVVVNGDQALAERICALLNGERPARIQVSYTPPSPEDLSKIAAAFLDSVGRRPTMLPHTPEVDHARGAAEALAQVAERIANAADNFDADALKTLRIILEATEAELGADEHTEGCR